MTYSSTVEHYSTILIVLSLFIMYKFPAPKQQKKSNIFSQHFEKVSAIAFFYEATGTSLTFAKTSFEESFGYDVQAIDFRTLAGWIKAYYREHFLPRQ